MEWYDILIITIVSLFYTSLFMWSVFFSFLKKKWNNSIKWKKKWCEKFHRNFGIGKTNYCFKQKPCYF